MLGLTQQVGSHKYGIGRPVGQDFHLRRSGRHVDGHITQTDQLLGRRDILIAGTKNLIHLGDALRTVGHCCYCLYATGLEHLPHTRYTGGEQNGRMYLSVTPRRGTQHNLPTPSYAGRHCKHQYRGKQGGRSSRDVQSHFLDGYRLLPADNPRTGFYLLAFKTLRSVEGSNIVSSQPDGSLQLFAHPLFGFLELLRRYRQGRQFHLVKLAFIFAYSLIALRLYATDDALHHAKQTFRIHDRALQQLLPLRLFRIINQYHNRLLLFQIIIFSMGNTRMPSAPNCFSFPMISQKHFSSSTV